MIVLDTNILSELMKENPHPKVRDYLLNRSYQAVSTTSITLAEITFGIERLPKGKRRSDLQEAFFKLIEPLPILTLDDKAAILAGAFSAQRDALGLSAAPSDMMIAGITAAAGAILATRNTKDFENIGLEIHNPWALDI